MNRRIAVLIAAISGTFALAQSVAANEAAPVSAAEPLYASVNGKAITQKEFQLAFANHMREKYYHRQVPEDKISEARQEVGNRLINRALLLAEATRRGLAADDALIAKTIAEYDVRYAASERWQKNRETMLPGLTQQLKEQDLLRQAETIGRTVPEPSTGAVHDYYKTHPELFTEPEKLRLHSILLKVEPSAPKALWDAAREEAARIVTRLRAGKATFEELASLHSQDSSAEKGGDMGYLHRGMIPEQVQSQIDERQLGTVGDPIDVLEGVAIFRLDERIPSKLVAFEKVSPRARELLLREQTEQAWESFISGLRKASVIELAQPVQPATAGKN